MWTATAEKTRAEILVEKLEALKTELLTEAQAHSDAGQQDDCDEACELWKVLSRTVDQIEEDWAL
jgi:hypothetical protein